MGHVKQLQATQRYSVRKTNMWPQIPSPLNELWATRMQLQTTVRKVPSGSPWELPFAARLTFLATENNAFKKSLQVTHETWGLPPTARPTGRLAEYLWRKHTSMLPPPILELKSLRTPRKSAWSFSRMISSTISLACYMGKEVTVSLKYSARHLGVRASIVANWPLSEEICFHQMWKMSESARCTRLQFLCAIVYLSLSKESFCF